MHVGTDEKSPAIELIGKTVMTGICAGILLAMLSPYRTETIFSVGERFLFWIASAVFGCFTLVAFYLTGRNIAQDYRIVSYAWLPLSAALAAVPVTLMVHAVAPAVNSEIELQPFWQLFPSVLILCLPLQLITHLLLRTVAKPPLASALPTVANELSPLLAKLPPHLGRDIMCLKMEDHYLRVYTAVGHTLILMRISDAVKMLHAVDGQQVHRSWWVARTAVDESRMDGNRLLLVLRNGLRVPVSKDRRAILEAKGWLTG